MFPFRFRDFLYGPVVNEYSEHVDTAGAALEEALGAEQSTKNNELLQQIARQLLNVALFTRLMYYYDILAISMKEWPTWYGKRVPDDDGKLIIDPTDTLQAFHVRTLTKRLCMIYGLDVGDDMKIGSDFTQLAVLIPWRDDAVDSVKLVSEKIGSKNTQEQLEAKLKAGDAFHSYLSHVYMWENTPGDLHYRCTFVRSKLYNCHYSGED